MIPTPHLFQMDWYERTRASVARGNRIIVCQGATGCGKTTFASFTAKQAVVRGRKVLFMVHRRRLVDQISDRLSQFEVDHGVIMRGEKPYGNAPVQVASRDTIISRCYRNIWNGLPPADVVIVDEGHHAAQPDSEYRRILENYQQAIVLLLTATPVGPDGQGLGPWAHDIQCAAPTSQLVKDGFLVPVKCYAPDRKRGLGGKMKRGIAGDLVESWKQYAENMPTVLFCSRVQHSLDAVQCFKEAGIPAAHVDADTPDDTRDQIFDCLGTDEIKVVSNVGIVKEGVDVPCLGCVQFYMDPSGRVGFLQGCGRIMRPYPGKQNGVLIDHSGAVFLHGFPDEDTPWTLEGNTDAEFKKKKDAGLTAQVNYCKDCELLYHDKLACPQCGKMPSKPPRSIFAPPPVEHSNEVLTEADRGQRDVYGREEKVKHWLRCLAVAANRNDTFAMASQIYRQKYGQWPEDGFPCLPGYGRHKDKVADVYPKFRKRALNKSPE